MPALDVADDAGPVAAEIGADGSCAVGAGPILVVSDSDVCARHALVARAPAAGGTVEDAPPAVPVAIADDRRADRARPASQRQHAPRRHAKMLGPRLRAARDGEVDAVIAHGRSPVEGELGR